MSERHDHDEIEALLALRALGGIETDDERQLEREMAERGDCPECRRLAAEHHETAGRLAFALSPESVPADLEEHVLATLRRERGADAVPPGSRRSLVREVVAVAAAVVAFVAGWTLRGTSAGPTPAEALAGAHVVALQGTAARVSVAYRPGEAGAFLFGSGLPSAPAGHTYELWIIRSGSPRPMTCFAPRGSEGGVLEFFDETPRPGDTVAVTVEASSCPSAPTTSPILSGRLPS